MLKIIGICGIRGAGKSLLTHELSKSLNATALFWDNFDPISKAPDDYVKWYQTTRDYNEWQYDALAEVLKQLKAGKKVVCPITKKELTPTNYIIFDAPLGRKHIKTGQYIDYAIFLNTPLDIALARRILRDFRDKSNLNIAEIFEELDTYLTTSRPLYMIDYETPDDFDLDIDGSLPVDQLVTDIEKWLKFDAS
jgi:uridine kinase